MYSTRLVQLLMVALSILIATRASWFHHDVGARQLSIGLDDGDSTPADESGSASTAASPTPTVSGSETGGSSTSSGEPTSSSDEPSSSESTPTPTPTDSTSSTSSQSSPPTSSSTGPITTPPTSKPTTPASSSSSNNNDSNTETTDDTKSSTPTPVTKTKTIFYTSTDGSGQTHVGSSEAVVVSTPGFSGGDGSKGSGGGITATQRNIIIGVTVGVGGAIILAAGGILYWRLRNKRRSQEENEELISYGAGFGGPGTAEKSEASGPSASARSPFQSTLENYHAPTQTNAASNF
ncbi:hypothetical protein F4803DRAFT_542811 [Xylaria telfairii]|nr:hypothetical protein F4803DRAFT_542811 [Xylaria telfairii]